MPLISEHCASYIPLEMWGNDDWRSFTIIDLKNSTHLQITTQVLQFTISSPSVSMYSLYIYNSFCILVPSRAFIIFLGNRLSGWYVRVLPHTFQSHACEKQNNIVHRPKHPHDVDTWFFFPLTIKYFHFYLSSLHIPLNPWTLNHALQSVSCFYFPLSYLNFSQCSHVTSKKEKNNNEKFSV